MNELLFWLAMVSLPVLAFASLYQFVWNLRNRLPPLPKDFTGTSEAWDTYHGRLNDSQSKIFEWFLTMPKPFRRSLLAYADEYDVMLIKMGMKDDSA